MLLLGWGSAVALAGIVGEVDPPGGGAVDAEIGNLTEVAFEALGPLVNDHEGGSGPQTAGEPFSIGDVRVTGAYNEAITDNYTGNRTSFTVDASGVGTWVYAAADGPDNIVGLQFEPQPGDTVTAVGLVWMGRDNRWADSVLSATVTYVDGTTETTPGLTIDGNGDGLPNGKDVFVGFEDRGGHGGVARLDVRAAHPTFFFHGWDDVGVVVRSALSCCPAGPGSSCDLGAFIEGSTLPVWTRGQLASRADQAASASPAEAARLYGLMLRAAEQLEAVPGMAGATPVVVSLENALSCQR